MAEILKWRRRSQTGIPLVLITGLPGRARDLLPGYLESSMPGITLPVSLTKHSAQVHGCLTCEYLSEVCVALNDAGNPECVDRIVVKLADDCDPLAFATSLEIHSGEIEEGLPRLEIDTVLTVVDATTFWSDLAQDVPLTSRNDAIQGQRKPCDSKAPEVAELLVNQLEFCDIVLLVHRGVVDSSCLSDIERTIRMLQPRAEILRSYDERISAAGKVVRNRYDSKLTAQSARWRQVLKQAESSFAQPVKSQPRATTLVFRQRRPLHPERFYQLVIDWPVEVIRCFGTVWFATSNDLAFSFSQIGPTAVSFSVEGEWLAALPAEERLNEIQEQPELMRYWDGKFGDRYTELVFIGERIDQPYLLERLNACLLTDWEMRLDWSRFNDPILGASDDDEVERCQPSDTAVEGSQRGSQLRLVYSSIDATKRSD